MQNTDMTNGILKLAVLAQLSGQSAIKKSNLGSFSAQLAKMGHAR